MEKIIIFLLISLVSCQSGNVKRELVKFVGQEIVVPEGLQGTVNGRDSLVAGFLDADMKLVVFYDSVGCSSCRVSHMYEWQDVITYSEHMGARFKTIFIFAPKESAYNELRISLRGSQMDYPMFIDRAGEFLKRNPAIPADSRFHTFLLDKNNKVVMVGNPANNDQLWNLYKDQIRELSAQ